MEQPYRYVIVHENTAKQASAAAEFLIESMEAGYAVLSAVPTGKAVHYVLMYTAGNPLESAAAEDHELDEEELQIIEDNIDVAMKDIKKRNA